MPPTKLLVRDPVAADEPAWRDLWTQYNEFYETKVAEAVTAHTWRRILDPTMSMFCRIAVLDDAVVGFSNGVVHDITWAIAPVCHLEDLFVAPAFRGRGIGRMLIADLVARAKSNGWSRLYWHTRSGNPARRLYDEFVAADDFVRYRLYFP